MNKRKQRKSTSSKTIVVLKRVGRSSDDSGRIYLPGSWIGKTVRVAQKIFISANQLVVKRDTALKYVIT